MQVENAKRTIREGGVAVDSETVDDYLQHFSKETNKDISAIT
jgi:hypothetical protein